MREPIVEHKRSDARRARLLACAFNVGGHIVPYVIVATQRVADNIARNSVVHLVAQVDPFGPLGAPQEIIVRLNGGTPACTPLLCSPTRRERKSPASGILTFVLRSSSAQFRTLGALTQHSRSHPAAGSSLDIINRGPRALLRLSLLM